MKCGIETLFRFFGQLALKKMTCTNLKTCPKFIVFSARIVILCAQFFRQEVAGPHKHESSSLGFLQRGNHCGYALE
jgi:hypothetical protein